MYVQNRRGITLTRDSALLTDVETDGKRMK